MSERFIFNCANIFLMRSPEYTVANQNISFTNNNYHGTIFRMTYQPAASTAALIQFNMSAQSSEFSEP
jgi:hypothetical protein